MKWVKVMKYIWYAIVILINLIFVAGMVATAYAQNISPQDWDLSTVVVMTFPFWLACVVVLLLLDIAFWRRTALIPGIGLLLCLGAIHDYCPLNIPSLPMSEAMKERSFTLMTYNVFEFCNYDGMGSLKDEHRKSGALEFILQKRPDIVCVQEATGLAPSSSNFINTEQLDTMYSVYPYVLVNGTRLAFLSKYPAEPINLDFPERDFRSGNIAAWRVKINGQVVNIFSVHLRSLGLTNQDKGAYMEMFNVDSLKIGSLKDLKNDALPKLASAGVERAEQIALLQKYLSKYGGKNAIVCGDFNDVVGCYGLHLLTTQSKMRQAYSEVGFGPMVTYYGTKMYFRIDHILYRGNMHPYKMSRGHVDASDHYPLIATFVMDKPK